MTRLDELLYEMTRYDDKDVKRHPALFEGP